jgi:hypothetical protein
MEMHRPGPEHDRLKPFAGNFRARVKMWMGPGEPMVATGMMHSAFDLDGLFLRQEYRGDPGEGPFPGFQGRGYWGYNLTTKRYEGFWIDTASSLMQTEFGTVDKSGKVWTMTGQMPDPQTGSPLTKRSVVTLQSDDQHKLEMYFGKDGQEFKAMEIEYTRSR